MSRITVFGAWLVLSALWAGAVFYFAMATAPHVPLDISPSDPATEAALGAAMTRHLLAYGLVAAVPPLLLLGVSWLLMRQRQ